MTEKLEDVEIFKVGTWNGDTYTEEDLEKIVANFEKLRGEQAVPVKIGHSENQKLLEKEGIPAAGWIQKLKKIGKVLIATISDIPKKVADLIEQKAYKKVSAEIYPTFKDENGKVYEKVLRAVALLGGEIPAVSGLKDIQARYNIESGQAYLTYSLDIIELNEGERENQVLKYSYLPKVYTQKLQTDYDEQVDRIMEKNGCSREEAIIYLDEIS